VDGSCSTVTNVSGARSAGDCVTSLGAVFASQTTGSNLDATSWYQYRVAYFDSVNYQYSGNKSNPLQTGSILKGILLSDIPLGPSGTTKRIIYRTEGYATRALAIAATAYYKLAEISDNSTQTYTDNIADATILADAVPKWSTVSAGINASPYPGKFLLINNERLWFANDSSIRTDVDGFTSLILTYQITFFLLRIISTFVQMMATRSYF